MADIFDEIDEDLKRDRMQVLWTRYGKVVMTAVAAIVLLVASFQGYAAWQTSQAETSASAYQQALQSDDVVAELEAQLNYLSDGYAMLAQFQIASEQVASNDFAAAEASYMALASDTSLDPLYKQAATFETRDSLNISSVNDDGSGLADTNYTNNFNSDDYAAAGAACRQGTNSISAYWTFATRSTVVYSTSSTSWTSGYNGGQSSVLSALDCDLNIVTVHGDLA